MFEGFFNFLVRFDFEIPCEVSKTADLPRLLLAKLSKFSLSI